MPRRHTEGLRKPHVKGEHDMESPAGSGLWHQIAIPDAFELLNTSESGLTSEEALHRLSVYGRNVMEPRERHTPFRILV
jgi:hypothetical protein